MGDAQVYEGFWTAIWKRDQAGTTKGRRKSQRGPCYSGKKKVEHERA